MKQKENSKLVSIKIESEAKENINQIAEYISKDSIYYANKTIEGIVDKIKYLALFPYMGRKIPEYNREKYRELIYKSYRIFYRVNSNISILRIVHHSRDILNLSKFFPI